MISSNEEHTDKEQIVTQKPNTINRSPERPKPVTPLFYTMFISTEDNIKYLYLLVTEKFIAVMCFNTELVS